MGSRSAAKASRNKAVSTAGTNKGSAKPGNADDKQGQGEESEELDDLSILRKSVGTSVNGLLQALKVFQTGTEEIRNLLSQECKVIYECRVCDNLFRSLANFLSHKRIYCKGVASALHPSGSSPCQPNGLLLPMGQCASAGEAQSQDGSLEMVIVQPEPPAKRQRNESPENWTCNESTPSEDSTLAGPLPKIECSVPPIRRRKDICGVIEKLSKRASRQNLANATAVASHFASFTGGKLCLDNAAATSASNALYMENISESKNAIYQTLLTASSTSMNLLFPTNVLERSKMSYHKEMGGSSKDVKNPALAQDLNVLGSLPNLTAASIHLSNPNACTESEIADCAPSFPVPHSLLIKNRVALMKEAMAESESAVLGPDGILIPPKTNGPMYPPEVCSGGVSNSEGEEVEDEDEEGEETSPKGKAKADSSKGPPSEEKQEIICSICKAKFSTRKTLSHHMKSLHVMFRTYYRCPCCKNCFANNWSVYRHLYKVHRKTTDQVRKLRALIKKKAFRKKILLPLPNSSQHPPQNTALECSKNASGSVTSSAPEKMSPPPVVKPSTSSASSTSKIVSSAPGRSGSPLPPPSEATQFPAISAQHAQVLRKLENIVKQEDNNWRLESYPERPGMGQSCPGCNRRFERRAALASHAHSCHKRILLAAQKASRARNKQQQQKMAKTLSGRVKTGDGCGSTGKPGKDAVRSKELSAKHPGAGKQIAASSKLGKNLTSNTNFQRSRRLKREGNSSGEEGEVHGAGRIPSKPQHFVKSFSQKVSELIGFSPKASLDAGMSAEKLKEEEWDEMERPNSESSFGTHRDSSSPITIPTHPGRQQRIGIQIRKDYVKGDRTSMCSSSASPPPYPPVQVTKEEDYVDDDIVVLSSTFPKANNEPGSCVLKDSLSADIEMCSDREGSSNSCLIGSSSDVTKQQIEKNDLPLRIDDVAASKNSTEAVNVFQSDEESSIEEQAVNPDEKEKLNDEVVQVSQVEGIMGHHGEVKRVFLEVIVGGVADPNSLTMDDEESERIEEDKEDSGKREKRDPAGPRKAPPPPRGKVPSSMTAVQRQGGRPVRNRVKVEREDFIYDLSDMKLSPTKKDDVISGSSHGLAALKKPRRNVSQQQAVSSVSQGTNSVQLGSSSSVRQFMVPNIVKVDGSSRAQSSNALPADGGQTLRVYSGKAVGGLLPPDKSNKVPVSTKGSCISTAVGSQKLSDCKVVIGGLRSGDVTQLSVRRVYGGRKVFSPSNISPMAIESEETVSYGSLKKCPPSKDCTKEPSEVDDGLYEEISKLEAYVLGKQTGKSSTLLYQSDSLDSGDSVSDFGSVPQRNSPVDSNELSPST